MYYNSNIHSRYLNFTIPNRCTGHTYQTALLQKDGKVQSYRFKRGEFNERINPLLQEGWQYVEPQQAK